MSTATTHIKTEKKLVPALRFKEFEGEWSIKPLGSECNHISYGLTVRPDFVETGIPLISAREITSGVVNIEKGPKISQEEFNKLSDKAKPKKGDVFLTKTGTIGLSARFMLDIPIAITQNIAVIRLNDVNVNSAVYLIQYFKTRNFYRSAMSRVNQSTIMDLQLGDIRKLLIPFAEFPEQQKIASFLSAVDQKIQQLFKKKELLEQYKKGVMQQLYSDQLRFKDGNGNSYPDWQWVGGNKLFDNISDKKHNSDLPILAITQDQGAIPRDLINYKMTVTEKSVASYKVVQIGDFVISLRTFQGGIEFSDYHGICSPAYIILRPSSDNVDRTFYKFYLKTSFYIKQLQKNLEGIRDGKMISYKYFSEIKVPFPSHPEQQKIAIYLSSIDTKIERINNQIIQTQTFKKGLLQQMFVAA